MATNAAIANSTTQPAELSNYISTIAAQIANVGTITNTTILSAKNLAAAQLDMVAVRHNIETYYETRGVSIIAPNFEEWIDKDGSGIVPKRIVPVSGLKFIDMTGVEPQQQISSDNYIVNGLGLGVFAPVTVSAGTTIKKNGFVVTGLTTTVQDGDTIALCVTSLGYGLTNKTTITIGSTSALWQVITKALGGTISNLGGTGLTLQINGVGDIVIPSGSSSFSFPGALNNGENYSITILTQPTYPLQICTISNGAGIVGSVNSNISLICETVSSLAYIANQGDNITPSNISAYAIHPSTGALSSIGTYTAGIAPLSITVEPFGKYAYVVNANSNNITAYTINSGTGELNSIGTFWAGTSPWSITVVPNGKFAYVATSVGNVLAYSINSSTGALTSIGTVSVSGVPNYIIADPTGKFVYTTNNNSDNVTAFKIDADTGILTNNGTIVLGLPQAIAIEPTGKFAYIPGNPGISAYNINPATGALTSIGIYATGLGTSSIAIDPTGMIAYAGTSNLIGDALGITAYRVDTTTGVLCKASTYAEGTDSHSIVFDPSGKFIYFRNLSTGMIHAYNVSSSGELISIGTYAAGTNPSSIAVTRVP